ncbi:MAG: phasin family protein [Sphingomonadales bacterium]|nr:phasin family protein [Sphingomonadales bacterium]
MTTTRTAKPKKITVKSLTADVQSKAKSAYAKGSEVAGEIGTITKGNVEAVVASSKILGAGLKELGDSSIAEGKQAASTVVADFKALAAVKTPKDFFDFQFKLAKRNIDSAIALSGKNGKALGKLASDAAAPISSQIKANVAKLRKAA